MIPVGKLTSPAASESPPEPTESATVPVFDPPPARARELAEAVRDAALPLQPPSAAGDRPVVVRQPYHFD
jgi:hypothetical protein